MKIKSLVYEDKSRHWSLNRVEFNDLTLLVGASGVGKTQILRAIYNITQIAQGASLNGIKWHIEFEDTDQTFYQWSGEFENLGYKDNPFEDENDTKPKITCESIVSNDIEVIKRKSTDIFFKGNPTVKLSQNQSVLALIQDKPIICMTEMFRLITFNDYTSLPKKKKATSRDLGTDPKMYPDLQSVRHSNADILIKLYLCSRVAPEVFDTIKQLFMDIFPFVENIRMRLINQNIFPSLVAVQLQLKEKDVDRWIPEKEMSLGMHRTLLQISELHLCTDGTVFLIDEFENSLGINCIDDLTSTLMTYERDLQFIITSHHPYIINNISYKNWKIVTRNGGVVTAKDATDYDIGKSKHQAFTQLINLDAYSEGIAE